MTKNSKPKAKVNDTLFHVENEKLYIVDSVDKIRGERLYTIKEITNGEPQYKRYYESKLSSKCVKTKNSKAVKILYGRNK